MENTNRQPAEMLCLAHYILNDLRVVVNIFKIRELQIQFWSSTSWKIRRPAKHWPCFHLTLRAPWLPCQRSFPRCSPILRSMLHSCLSAWLPGACDFANLHLGQFLHFQQKVNLPEATHQVRGTGGRKSASGIFLSNTAHCLSRGPQLLSAFLLPITYIFKVEHVTFSTFPLIHSFLYVWISL